MIKKFFLGMALFLTLALPSTLQGQDALLGEVKMFAGNFAPRGWALCEGQLLSISQNQALFSLLGTTYGGDGRTTFALPDLRGRTPVGVGRGPGLSDVSQGTRMGSETTTLTARNLPSHNHNISVDLPTHNFEESGEELMPGNSALLGVDNPVNGTIHENFSTVNSGANQPFNNIQPSLGMRFIICTQGIFPSRS